MQSANKSSGHDSYAAFRFSNFRIFVSCYALATIGSQMLSLAVGWELYQLTGSAAALGFVGLAHFLPVLFFTVPAGNLVDRVSRKQLILATQAAFGVLALCLAASSSYNAQLPDLSILSTANGMLAAVSRLLGETSGRFLDRHIPILLLIVALNGLVRSVNQPTRQALLPQLVPAEVFPNAVTWNSSVFELSTVTGPALGGAILALVLHFRPDAPWAYSVVYLLTGILQLSQLPAFARIKLAAPVRKKEPLSLSTMLAGVRFVYRTKLIYSAILLDMLAVLFGGARALFPVFAAEVLFVGPLGLGSLRAAESIGAVIMATSAAHRKPFQRAGRALLIAVTGYGIATIGFGLSRNFTLSFLLLVAAGACDNISVIVRQTLVQTLTPDEMRGRVSAVQSVFISSSNELGALESGLTAAWLGGLAGSAASGAVLSVLFGGMMTVLIVLTIAKSFPQLRALGPLNEIGVVDDEEKAEC